MEKEENILSSAVIALVAERKELAQRLLLHTLARNPNSEQAWLYLATTLPNVKAVEALQKVLVLNPQNKLALKNLMLLRRYPDLTLTLDHVMEQPTLPALFGEEPPTIPLATFEAKFEEKTQAFFNHAEIAKSTLKSPQIKSFSLEDVGISFEFNETAKSSAAMSEKGRTVEKIEPIPKRVGGEHADSSSAPLTSVPTNEHIPAYLRFKQKSPNQTASADGSRPSYPSYSSYYTDSQTVAPYRASHYNPVNMLEKPRVRLKERPVRRYREPLHSGTGLTGLGLILTLILLVLVIVTVYSLYFAP
jgi:hypothetical protein